MRGMHPIRQPHLGNAYSRTTGKISSQSSRVECQVLCDTITSIPAASQESQIGWGGRDHQRNNRGISTHTNVVKYALLVILRQTNDALLDQVERSCTHDTGKDDDPQGLDTILSNRVLWSQEEIHSLHQVRKRKLCMHGPINDHRLNCTTPSWSSS